MKILVKCLIAVFAVVVMFAAYDSLRNGLFSGDDYKPVTEQLQDVKSNK